jgi:hypothetical protein
MKSFRLSMGLVVLLAGLPYGASGGEITGTVKDPGGTPFKGVFVRARNQKSKITVNVLSDRQGRYQIKDLPPGDYDVQATAIGFKSDPRAGVKVETGQALSLDFAMQKGMVRWSDLSAY